MAPGVGVGGWGCCTWNWYLVPACVHPHPCASRCPMAAPASRILPLNFPSHHLATAFSTGPANAARRPPTQLTAGWGSHWLWTRPNSTHPGRPTLFPLGSVSHGLHRQSPSTVVPAAPDFQRNFPEAPGRVTPCWKRRLWAEGWRGGEGTGKTAESCFLSRNAQVRGCSLAPPVWLGSQKEGADLRILLCSIYDSGELRKKAENLEQRHLPPQRGPTGRVGTVGLASQRPTTLQTAL